jgi:hypothetical protein
MGTRVLRPEALERWTDERLAEAIRDMWGRMTFHGVRRWEDLPETERTRAWLLSIEHRRRYGQPSLF